MNVIVGLYPGSKSIKKAEEAGLKVHGVAEAAKAADVIMILTGLFAAFNTEDGSKWGWYAWACLAYLVVVYQLAFNGRTAVASKDGKTKAFYGAIAGFTLILWTVYPM